MTSGDTTQDENIFDGLILSRDGSRAYQVVDKLGQGGCGEVYEVKIHNNKRFRGFKKPVESAVLKVASRSLDPDREKSNIEALLTEYNIYRTPSRNIVKLLDYGQIPRQGKADIPYIVMERLHLHPYNKFEFSGEQSVDIATSINSFINLLYGLKDIQRRKNNALVLCDIKPENIMLRMSNSQGEIGDAEYLSRIATNSYEPVFMDMGCAQSRKELNQTKGKLDYLIGTPMYLPPEAVPDVSKEKLEPGTYGTAMDVYALTLTFYQFLTGARPYGHYKWVRKPTGDLLMKLLEAKNNHVSPFDKTLIYDRFSHATAKDIEQVLTWGSNPDPRFRGKIEELFDLCQDKFKVVKRRVKSVGTYYFDGVRGIDWSQKKFPQVKRDNNQYTRRIRRHTTRKKRKDGRI